MLDSGAGCGQPALEARVLPQWGPTGDAESDEGGGARMVNEMRRANICHRKTIVFPEKGEMETATT